MDRLYRLLALLFVLSAAGMPSARAETNAISMGPDAGGSYSYTAGIFGDIVLIQSSTTNDAGIRSYAWRNSTATDIGSLGGLSTIALRANANGVVVGMSETAGGVRHAFRWANGVMTDLGTLGGNQSYADGISTDGSVVAGGGETSTPGNYRVFRWENGLMTDLGSLGSGQSSFGALSGDGSTVVGASQLSSPGIYHAFRWTNGVMTDLGVLTGDTVSNATRVSANGAVVSGTSSYGSNTRTFRWENGVMSNIGSLGGNQTILRDMSPDGRVLVGEGNLTAGSYAYQVFRWQDNVMTNIGSLGGTSMNFSAMTRDGNVIIGTGDLTGNNGQHAFRWQGGTLTDLGSLGGNFSYATALSTDGQVVIGGSDTMGRSAVLYRWRADTGMKSLEELLTASNVNLTGWDLVDSGDGQYISADGQVIAGTAFYNGQGRAYIFREVPPTPSNPGGSVGIITPGQLAASLASVAATSQQVAQTTAAQVGTSLFMARQLIPPTAVMAATVPQPAGASIGQTGVASGNAAVSNWTMYASGGLGYGQNNDYANHDFNGTVGVKRRVTDDVGLGIGLIGARAQNDLAFGGRSSLDAYGLSGIAAYTPFASGLRLFGSVFGAALNLDVKRGYANGAGLDASRGKTDGFAYGAAGQAGWQFAAGRRTTLMPYAELRWSQTRIDGYAERGGAFAGSFGDQDVSNTTSRLGVEPRYALTSAVSLLGRAAWGHRLTDDAGSVNANVSGLTQGLGNDAGDRDWAEGTIGVNWQASYRTAVGMELTGRSGDTAEPQLSAVASVSVKF